MRIALALASILVIGTGVQAKAQDIGRICAREADAKALRGQERARFEASCKASRGAGAIVIGHGRGEPASPLCAGNVANAFVGACPICVLLLALSDDSQWYVR